MELEWQPINAKHEDHFPGTHAPPISEEADTKGIWHGAVQMHMYVWKPPPSEFTLPT